MNIFVIGSFVQACCWAVDKIPKPGETLKANGIHIEAGGKGLNVAICCQRLDENVHVMLGIGNDDAADSLIKLLAAEHISSEFCFRLSPQSGYGAGMISSCGQNAIAVYPGPNLLLNHHHVDIAKPVIEQADVIYGQFEGAYEAIEASFALAKQFKARTILNPSPYQTITANLLNNTDIIIVNEVEIIDILALSTTNANLTNLTTLQAWQVFLVSATQPLWQQWQNNHITKKLLVITLGHLGCIAINQDLEVTSVPTFAVNIIDTIGCGDAFASGFCKMILQTSLVNTLRYANACGAIVANQKGVLSALPTATTVQDFLIAKAYC